MIDSSQVEYIPASPTFLISQLSDPTFVGTVCRPFLNNNDEYFNKSESDLGKSDFFSLSLAENVLIPSAINNIKANNSDAMQNIPSLVKLIIDNHGYDGLSLVMDKVIPELITSYRKCLSSASKSTIKLIGDVLCSISSKFRDETLIEVITKSSCDPEPKLHILAAYLIPLVRDSSRVLSIFRSLSLDRVPQVRSELVKGLPNCNFDDSSIIKYILVNSSKDQNVTVRRSAAMIFGKVAPELIEEFSPLLESSDTVKAALKSVKEIVIQNGLAVISKSFQKACMMEPELSAAVLLNISKVVQEEEKSLLLNFAFLLKYTNNLTTHLFKFSQNFSDKEVFIDLLTPNIDGKQMLERQWRTRKNLLEQAILFIPVLHEKLVKLAELFSKDSIAIIRNMSVDLWVALINDVTVGNGSESLNNEKDSNAIYCDDKNIVSERRISIIAKAKVVLMNDDNWHTRLVLAKIISAIGISNGFEDVAEKLSHDNISNVRYCIANNVVNTDYFQKFFESCNDLDILQLRQQNAV